MHALPRIGRVFAVVAVLLGILSTTAIASAKPSQRRVIATAAAVRLTEVKARAAQRDVRYLRVVARRACATHHKRACRASRKHLASAQARVTHLQQLLHWLTSGAGASNSSSSSSGSAKSPLVERPRISPPPPVTGFQPGVDAGTNMVTDVAGASALGAKAVRIEFSIGQPAAQLQPVIEGYAAKGIRVAPLAGFSGRIPTPAEAQNLAGWAKTYGPGGSFWAGRSDGQLAIQSIEFGNETSGGYQYGDNAGDPSYTARAQAYAVRLKEAAEAISGAGTNVGLLAVSEDWTGDWVNGMYSAVPNLHSYVAGWVSHAYGPGWHTKIEDIINQTAAHGAPSTIPIDITEWGLASDNGHCLTENYGYNRCMSYQEAAETLRSSFGEVSRMLGSRLGLFMLYQVRDQQSSGSTNQREAYFGALQHELQPKGAYTTQVQALMAS